MIKNIISFVIGLLALFDGHKDYRIPYGSISDISPSNWLPTNTPGVYKHVQDAELLRDDRWNLWTQAGFRATDPDGYTVGVYNKYFKSTPVHFEELNEIETVPVFSLKHLCILFHKFFGFKYYG